MEVDFKHSIYNKVTTPKGNAGIVTNLGVDGAEVPVLWVEYNNMDIKDGWEVAAKCKSAPSAMSKSTHVDFYYNILQKVETPLSSGIVTFLNYAESEKVSCYIENNIQGVANSWWATSTLNLEKAKDKTAD